MKPNVFGSAALPWPKSPDLDCLMSRWCCSCHHVGSFTCATHGGGVGAAVFFFFFFLPTCTGSAGWGAVLSSCHAVSAARRSFTVASSSSDVIERYWRTFSESALNRFHCTPARTARDWRSASETV